MLVDLVEKSEAYELKPAPTEKETVELLETANTLLERKKKAARQAGTCLCTAVMCSPLWFRACRTAMLWRSRRRRRRCEQRVQLQPK